MIRKFIQAILLLIPLIAVPVAQAAAGGVFNTSRWSGVAIEGTDTVAYFTESKAVEGSSRFTHEWKGAKWRFVSAANRELFAAAPEKYAPQFGGWCAWAVKEGYTASIDPDAWKIVDGKLYLNYSKSVQSQWVGDIPGNIKKAEANWPRLRAELSR
jgi:hypothetical protein